MRGLRLVSTSSSGTRSVSSHHPTSVEGRMDGLGHRVSQKGHLQSRIHVLRRFYMIGSHLWACRHSPRHTGHLLMGGLRLVSMSSSQTRSVCSHHPTLWEEHRACHRGHLWSRIHIPRRFCMIGSHRWAYRYSPRHTGHLLMGGLWLVGKSCSPGRRLSSHYPTHSRRGRVGNRGNHRSRLHSPRRYRMIGSNHRAYVDSWRYIHHPGGFGEQSPV